MEGPRFLLAIILSIAVVVVINILFPPPTPPERPAVEEEVPDTVERPDLRIPDVVEPEPLAPAPVPSADEDTVWIESSVARYGIATRGGALVSVELLGFQSFTRPGPVQLVEPEDRSVLGYSLRVGEQEVDFDRLVFSPTLPPGDTARITEPTVLAMGADVNGVNVRLEFAIAPDDFVLGFRTGVQGLRGADATLLLELGPRLAVNEADSAEDLRTLSYVTYSRRTGVESVRITNLSRDRIEEGPLAWVALRNKYFVAAALQPVDAAMAFGGLLAEGSPTGARSIRATLPLDRDGRADLRLFFGPQEYRRLAALGERMEEVNPYGWRIFRPIIRPLAEVVTWLLVAGRDVLGWGYGWVLILFGFVLRGLLWPLNAKAMRSQLKTMEVQPRIKEMQAKYKDKPEMMQKEMMRLYKEEGFNPLGGCIPMLIPWPVLITLFFVFQNTIEFRGVPFLWLPDLSRPDPYYILPVLMGASLWALQFMNMRAAPQDNPTAKMLLWFMPILMVVIFINFASGLNLYYAAMNVASLPQQILIIRERKRARARIDAKEAERAREENTDKPEAAAPPGGKGRAPGGKGKGTGGKGRKRRKAR